MQRIIQQEDLAALAAELGVRSDWHEPDEQGVTAVVKGDDLDNAGFWPQDEEEDEGRPEWGYGELYVELRKDDVPVAAVNLATLLSWAARP